MNETSSRFSSDNLIAAIEGCLCDSTCTLAYFVASLNTSGDSSHVTLRCAPSTAEAKLAFAEDGHVFAQPQARLSRSREERAKGREPSVDRLVHSIESRESIADLAEENYLWRGYEDNGRAVINFRTGRFIGSVNAPNVATATALVRRLATSLE